MSRNPRSCYAFLEAQGCPHGSDCRFRHDIQKCSCGLVLLSKYFTSHVNGNRHRKLLAEQAASQARPQPHLRHSGYHERTPRPPSAPPVQCERCPKEIPAQYYDSHMQYHQRRQRQADIRAALEDAEEDKHGIKVTGREGTDFGIVEEGDETRVVTLLVTKTDPESRIALSDLRMTSSVRKDETGERFSASFLGKSRWIFDTRPFTLRVRFHPSYAGRYEDTLELHFFDTINRVGFCIARRISATVGSREDHDLLQPITPYARRPRALVAFQGEVKPGWRPPVWTRTKWSGRLLDFKVPQDLADAVATEPRRALRAVKAFMPPFLSLDTYVQYFQVLTWIEEEQKRLELDGYSMFDVSLEPAHPRYNLKVQGLAENRPSVLVGDFILVKHTNTTEDVWDEGRVHKVYADHVGLQFGDDFSTYRGTKFDVRFVLNRLPERRMHQALANKNNPSRILFPGPAHLRPGGRTTLEQRNSFSPINRNIGEDEEQLETVTAILHQRPGSVPFVVFGPPGTGKTVTIIEAMRQILLRDPDARILACAPSNSAADLITQHLVVLGKTQVLRLNSLSRKYSDLPKSLRPFSIHNDNEVFVMPSLEELLKFRVVVSTCISGSVPSGLGAKRGHFTHIFIDEAGQGKEPELMIPIKTMASASTNIVLAGDPQQLGPILHSSLARALGLQLSYLARLMERNIYSLEDNCPAGGAGITIVKLVKNFRSHPAILEFSNTQFYNGDLQSCGNPVLIRVLERYEELPKKMFPIIFEGIVGRDAREGSSPSFFNIDEATCVKRHCLLLIGNRKMGIRAEHIIVITPYHAQVMKIRDLFRRDPTLQDIKVGSVEEFQGQESRVVVMSTVRSSEDYVESDIRRALGFVASPRRFNVALTRAQALLIVVGNPLILGMDPLWRSFLNYVHIRGGWKGRRMNWNPEDEVDPTATGYDSQVRDRAMGEAEDMITRLRTLRDVEVELSDVSDDELLPGDDDDIAVFRRGNE